MACGAQRAGHSCGAKTESWLLLDSLRQFKNAQSSTWQLVLSLVLVATTPRVTVGSSFPATPYNGT